MTQEEKDLLLRDLCGRLPYGVKIYLEDFPNATLVGVINDGIILHCDKYNYTYDTPWDIEYIKPYLFPISSMTEEQENEWYQLHVQPLFDRLGVSNRKEDLILQAKSLYIGTDWLNAHHFDYRGLIPMGLANDATGLNIY
jgi:hypothetical protein